MSDDDPQFTAPATDWEVEVRNFLYELANDVRNEGNPPFWIRKRAAELLNG